VGARYALPGEERWQEEGVTPPGGGAVQKGGSPSGLRDNYGNENNPNEANRL